MTGPEQGFLLLTSTLGDQTRKPLTAVQLRELAKRVRSADRGQPDRDLEIADLLQLGYEPEMARRIVDLLSATPLLREYLQRGQMFDCYPITRLNPIYPSAVRSRLGLDCPGVLWAKGDVTLLGQPAVAVIGSRELREENRKFGEAAGRKIAQQGCVLVSGNARGADRTAQEACLEAGGRVISIVADSLRKQPLRRNVLYLSVDDFDQGFSVQRAMRRNHVIHTMADLTIAVQCTLGKGGTWQGILSNLKNSWNSVCCFDDGSEAAAELQNRGVRRIGYADLTDLAVLRQEPFRMLE